MRGLAALGLAFGLVANTAAAEPAAAQIFGERVTVNARFKQPYGAGDFDGDGKIDQLYLVSIAQGSKPFAKDVSVVDRLFGAQALANGPEKIALAFAMGGGRKLLVVDRDFFASPIWSANPVPLGIAKRGSKPFSDFKRQEKRIANDIVVLGTEAGIDRALLERQELRAVPAERRAVELFFTETPNMSWPGPVRAMTLGSDSIWSDRTLAAHRLKLALHDVLEGSQFTPCRRHVLLPERESIELPQRARHLAPLLPEEIRRQPRQRRDVEA